MLYSYTYIVVLQFNLYIYTMSICVAHGWRGEIWIEIEDGVKIATKKALDASKIWSIHREIQILRFLQHKWCDFVPQLRDIYHDKFTYMRIEGKHFEDVYMQSKKQNEKTCELLLNLLERAYQLDVLWVIHGEFLRPFKNMIVSGDLSDTYTIYIIDFERGTLRDDSGKNMRHLAQWLHSEWRIDLDVIKWLGQIDREEIYDVLVRVMRGYSKQVCCSCESSL